MHICIFSRTFYPAVGGLERIAYILAYQAALAGQKVMVVTDTPGISDVNDQQFPFELIAAASCAPSEFGLQTARPGAYMPNRFFNCNTFLDRRDPA